jgi:hypothetical protein
MRVKVRVRVSVGVRTQEKVRPFQIKISARKS